MNPAITLDNEALVAPATRSLPRIITNKLGGYEVTFLKNTADTNGEYLLVQVRMEPQGSNGMHYHTTLVEDFEAVEGDLHLHVNGKHVVLKPGEKATAQLYQHHEFFNPGKEAISFRVTVTPARQFEQTMRAGYGLANDGLVGANGIPKSIWHLALLFQMGETYPSSIPRWALTLVLAPLATIGRLLGKEKELEKYYR